MRRALLPERASWLYEVESDTDENSGSSAVVQIQRLSEPLTFASSTEQWVGCDGSTAATTYDLGGRYTTLSTAVGLRDHTPEGLTARIVIRGDGDRVVLDETVTVGHVLLRQELDLTGIQQLTVQMSTEDPCGFSTTGYGALLDAWIR